MPRFWRGSSITLISRGRCSTTTRRWRVCRWTRTCPRTLKRCWSKTTSSCSSSRSRRSSCWLSWGRTKTDISKWCTSARRRFTRWRGSTTGKKKNWKKWHSKRMNTNRGLTNGKTCTHCRRSCKQKETRRRPKLWTK